MTPTGTPLADDDLGVRLRAALQQVTPLATDPVPPPRFAPQQFAPQRSGVVDLDVVEHGARRERSRRPVAAVAVLLAAAAAVVALVLTTDVGRGTATGPATGPTAERPTPAPTVTIPDRGGVDLGVTPDPDPWRCTAPAGTTIAAFQDQDQVRPIVWAIAAGVTCAPYPADRGRFTFTADGRGADFGSSPQGQEAIGSVSDHCLYVATGRGDQDPSFVSRGPQDHLEFYGSGCRLQLPTTPPTGAGDGLFALSGVLRCTWPTGTRVTAEHVTSPDHLDVWSVTAGATCAARPDEQGRYLFDPPRVASPADGPLQVQGTSACLMASSGGTSFTVSGSADYLEFFGPSCLVRSASR